MRICLIHQNLQKSKKLKTNGINCILRDSYKVGNADRKMDMPFRNYSGLLWSIFIYISLILTALASWDDPWGRWAWISFSVSCCGRWHRKPWHCRLARLTPIRWVTPTHNCSKSCVPENCCAPAVLGFTFVWYSLLYPGYIGSWPFKKTSSQYKSSSVFVISKIWAFVFIVNIKAPA